MKLKLLLILSAICTAISMFILVMHGQALKTPETPMGIIDLELARTTERASQIYLAWSPALTSLAIKNTYIDFLFLTSYGLLLFSLCSTVLIWYKGFWRLTGRWLSIAMIIAAFFDCFENILMIKILKGSLGKELVASTFMFASVKFLLVAVGILYIIISLVAKAFAIKRQTEK